LCCFSTVYIVVVVYFVIESVRKLLDTTSYLHSAKGLHGVMLSKMQDNFNFTFTLPVFFKSPLARGR